MLSQHLGGQDVNTVLRSVISSQVVVHSGLKEFLMEDLDFHAKEPDITKQVVYQKFLEIYQELKNSNAKQLADDGGSVCQKGQTRDGIDPLTLACYSALNFNQFEEYGIHRHRLMAVEVIHEAYVVKNGSMSLLVKDKVSESNRVLRLEILK